MIALQHGNLDICMTHVVACNGMHCLASAAIWPAKVLI